METFFHKLSYLGDVGNCETQPDFAPRKAQISCLQAPADVMHLLLDLQSDRCCQGTNKPTTRERERGSRRVLERTNPQSNLGVNWKQTSKNGLRRVENDLRITAQTPFGRD